MWVALLLVLDVYSASSRGVGPEEGQIMQVISLKHFLILTGQIKARVNDWAGEGIIGQEVSER